MSRGSRRVLFLASSAPRFAGDATAPFILNMAHDLCELGWEVKILAPHAPGASKRETLDGVTIHRFQYLWPARWQKLCYNGGAAVNLKRSRLNLLAVPLMAAAEFFNALLLLLRWRPALIHSHWAIPQGVIGQLLSLGGTPHVISVHGADIYGFRGRFMLALKRWALRRCDHVIANSSSTKSEVEALCTPRSLCVIPTGTTPLTGAHTGAIARESIADPDSRIILYAGRLIEAKGVRFLIEALPAVLSQQRATLLVVGDGPERAALEVLARKLEVDQHCVFAGPVPHSRIYDYFSIADVFVGPSIDIPGEWTEAQGNTFAEALFAGTPVVASRVGGIPDAVVHERTGLLVDQRAPDQIARSVLRIFSDAGLAGALKGAGRRHASEYFSRFRNARKLSNVYEAALKARGACEA